MRDQNSKLLFLIDTGSDISTVSARSQQKIDPLSQPLYAANGSIINTYGHRYLNLDLGFRRAFNFKFILAATQNNIIGADFLAQFHLCPDLTTRHLIDATTKFTRNLLLKQCSHISVSSINSTWDPRILELIRLEPIETKKEDSVEHHIVLKEGPPVFCRHRRLVGERLEAAKSYIKEMMANGIIQPGSGSWASPLHMVKKKDGSWRPCGDFRQLNQRTIPDRYPMRHIADFVNELHGCTIFSTIDLKSAYWHIPMSARSIEKTAITTPFGLYEFTKMPFGLRNASQTFQRFMDNILRELPFVYNYIDDLLIASKTEQDHKEHLKQVFQILANYKLSINMEKSFFFKQQIKFLGHIITAQGLQTDPKKVQPILDFPQPTSKRSVKSFLGMINQFRRFIPKIGHILAKLHEFDNNEFIWTTEHSNAFKTAKQALAQACSLNYPTSSGKFILTCDASDIAAGAVLEQINNGTKQPIAFMSRKFPKVEQNLSAFDKELTAIVCAIKHFQHFIEGCEVEIWTDHKPLITAFTKNEHQSPRQSRSFSFIAEFTDKLHHIAGSDNIVADALSRAEAVTTKSVSAKQIQEQQLNDLDVKLAQNDPTFKLVEIEPGLRIVCKVNNSSVCPLVPKTLRKDIFDAYHQLSHAGQKAMRKLVGKRYYWPNLNKDIDEWVKTCSECQMSKITKHTIIPPKQIAMPKRRFAHIHIDIVGPLKPSNEHKYLLTIVDRYTRWPEAIPLRNIEAQTIVDKIVQNWITRFGTPEIITTDRGLQFQSELFTTMSKTLACQHIMTAAYSPRANGLVERFHS